MNMDGSSSKPGGKSTRVGLVKTAVNMYGNRIADVNGPLLREEFSTKNSSKAKELHRARRDIVLYKESKQAAESAKAEAETKLSNAKRTVKDLFFMIGESSYRAKAQTRDTASLKKYRKPSKNVGDNEHSRVMRELEHAKRELFQLKLDVASVLEEKLRAEKQIETSRSNVLSCSRVAQKLMLEIEAANEEQVVVELARMDALKELRTMEALENARNKLKEAIKEIGESEELEKKLATTMYEIDILKNELKLVKKRVERGESMEHTKGETGDVGVLETIKEEIEAAKKDLASIRDKGFKFMASMDVIRNELKQVNAEAVHLKNTESKKGTKVRNVSYKLLRAKSKLEAVTAAEEKAESVVMNLSQTLNELRSETEAAKKEKEVIKEEVTATKEEIKKALLEINEGEERLQGAMQELERVKSSEALALEKLKILSENAMRERSLTNPSTLIMISKFEYEYLSNHAAEAKEIADKKVEAAKAWVEAVKANEKEIVMKTKMAERKLEEKMAPKRVNNEEFENWSKKREKYPSKELQRAMSRKSKKSEGSTTPSRVHKLQKGASPGSRPLSPFIVKKKKKVVPNWTKIFRGKKEKH
ncbi:protein PLASTID MOVEMENT IMPAIRED 2 [Vigna radiata var. radiata]|uniref:Protein PLASTID MOVEMENT IMPAIRED 2 n=1 Tax=Vigna radiata var. radiata TaxID=3916 RepID=A0A1S3UJ78_VIGRR|nr:protein PLASTID MOVEMENT IMPAIRED 2 [Vigna radiata var. radiata]